VRSRPRELGVTIGRLPTGARNAVTDVAGVRVGHAEVLDGPDGDAHAVRTGVTAIFPHEATPWDEPVYAGVHILNGYGETIGVNHLAEWGLLMTPIVLTSTAQIGKAYDGVLRWVAALDERGAREIMPVVTECDDGYLNDTLSFPLTDAHVAAALDAASGAEVAEGSVGAGVGMQCFDFKGGIGTSSRVIPAEAGGFTVGALVLTNHGTREELLIDGVPVGREIPELMPTEHQDGSCVVVVATDAPLLPHQLRRMAVRAGMGLARGGSSASNGSGEQMLAFSTANRGALQSYKTDGESAPVEISMIPDGSISELFWGAIEATEEAIVNALCAAETMTGRDGITAHALPHDLLREAMARYGRRPID